MEVRARRKGILSAFAGRRTKRQKVDEAIERGYRAFAARHPELVRSLFDLHFLRHGGRGVAEDVRGGSLPDPNALARAWVSQWAFSPEAADRHIERVLPSMREFVSAVEMELSEVGLLLDHSMTRSPAAPAATYG